MLVLHPHSQCDVCLDSYTASREPYAIPCGHVFCRSCLRNLRRHICPLCRGAYHDDELRQLHVDKATLPPATPPLRAPDLESGDRARQFQTQLTRMIRGGATASDLYEVQSELKPWLSTQEPDDHADLRATYTLLYRLLKGKQELADVEHQCADLRTEIETERQIAAAKYEELERASFEERELLLKAEDALKEENARLREEFEDLKLKYDDCSAECRRLSDELKDLKGNPLPPLPRQIEARHFYLHDLSNAKAEPVAILKDSPDSANAVRVQLIGGKDSFFQLSPVPPTIPDLPSGLMTFQPLTDDIDEAADDDRSHRSSLLSAPRAIPIQSKSPSYRSQTHAAALDPDAMAISVPRSTIDVHMASVSSSPNVSTMHYSSRPVEFVSNSVGRVPENALGIRTAEPAPRLSPAAISHEWREQQDRRERLAQLKEVLNDPVPSPKSSLSRKPTLSDASDRARPIAPSGLSSTRTPSPVSSTSHSYSASTLEKEYALSTHRHQLLQPGISSASAAALEHQQRTRASSTASATAAPAPSSLTHATATRDRDPAPPIHAIYAPAPPPASPARPVQPRRQSTDTASLSKGKAAAMGLASGGAYPSGLTRSMRAMQEAPRVS